MILTCVGQNNEIKGYFEWCVYFGNHTRASTCRASCHKNINILRVFVLSSCSTLAQTLNNIYANVEHEITRYACDSHALALKVRGTYIFHTHIKVNTQSKQLLTFSPPSVACINATYSLFVGNNDNFWVNHQVA